MCDIKFVDRQVLIMIRNHPGSHPSGLVKIANKEHHTRSWDRDTIRNAVTRLEKAGKVKSEMSIVGGKAHKKLYPAKRAV